MPLVYDQLTATDPGTTELAGPTRVSESVSRALTMAILVFEAIVVTDAITPQIPLARTLSDPIVVTESQTAVTVPLARLLFESVAITDAGSTELTNPIRVREFVDVYLSLPGPPPLTRAVVDEVLTTETHSEALSFLAQSLSETIAVADDVGQDYPILVRDVVAVDLSTMSGITIQFDAIAVTDAVSRLLYDTSFERSLAESLAVTDAVTRDAPLVGSAAESIAVTDALLVGGSIITPTASEADAVAITESVGRTLTPLSTSVSDSVNNLNDRAVGYLAPPMDQERSLARTVTVTEAVTAKYSALMVLVVDTVVVRENVRSRGDLGDDSQDQYQFRFRYQL